MPAPQNIEDRINAARAQLQGQLQVAADYVARNPLDVATRSLRSVATSSGVSPATLSRLARVLGFKDYANLRDAGRKAVGQKLVPFSQKARSLRQTEAGSEVGELFARQTAACQSNIAYLQQSISAQRLDAAVSVLAAADQVLLVGAMGSAGIVEHFGYQAQWFKASWRVDTGDGRATSAALSRMRQGDVVFALTKAPYAQHTVATVQEATTMGLTSVVLTDAHSAPILALADHGFVVPSESPNFFSSYTATLALMETIIALLLAKAGPEAETQIKDIEDRVQRLNRHAKNLNHPTQPKTTDIGRVT